LILIYETQDIDRRTAFYQRIFATVFDTGYQRFVTTHAPKLIDLQMFIMIHILMFNVDWNYKLHIIS
jgi:hypothetical protein